MSTRSLKIKQKLRSTGSGANSRKMRHNRKTKFIIFLKDNFSNFFRQEKKEESKPEDSQEDKETLEVLNLVYYRMKIERKSWKRRNR